MKIEDLEKFIKKHKNVKFYYRCPPCLKTLYRVTYIEEPSIGFLTRENILYEMVKGRRMQRYTRWSKEEVLNYKEGIDFLWLIKDYFLEGNAYADDGPVIKDMMGAKNAG